MPLSRALAGVLLTHPCPHCSHKLVKLGRYFQTIGHYRCEGCQRRVNLSYDDKLKLFDAHMHLI